MERSDRIISSAGSLSKWPHTRLWLGAQSSIWISHMGTGTLVGPSHAAFPSHWQAAVLDAELSGVARVEAFSAVLALALTAVCKAATAPGCKQGN